MKSLTPEQLTLLKKPLPPEALKPHPTKNFLTTIKAIYVVERFNDVFGIGGWEITNTFVERDGKFIVVKSTFEAKEYGIRVLDIFGGNDNADLGDAYKGACTDAVTKIGSYLGVGMEVYKGLADKAENKPKNDSGNTKQKPAAGNALPMASETQFLKVRDRIEAGEKQVYFKAIAEFSFTGEQMKVLKSAYDSIK